MHFKPGLSKVGVHLQLGTFRLDPELFLAGVVSGERGGVRDNSECGVCLRQASKVLVSVLEDLVTENPPLLELIFSTPIDDYV